MRKRHLSGWRFLLPPHWFPTFAAFSKCGSVAVVVVVVGAAVAVVFAFDVALQPVKP
jgi:hypothetical protein